MEEEKRSIAPLMERMEECSPSIFIGLTLGSIIYSLALFFRKSKDNAIFVGLWAPTLLALGVFHRIICAERKKS